MTSDEYEAESEGRATITATCDSATKLLREQIEASEYLKKDEARLERYAMAFGALLAFVPDERKAELLELVREGRSSEVAL